MSGSSSSATLDILPRPPHGRTGWPWTEAAPAAIYSTRADWPRVTIITPSYNQAAFLEETLRSVLLQGYPHLEYIVIDGGSTDGTVEILKKYSSWIDHWESEPDRGQSHAINKGLTFATGEWVNWLNSDDYLLPGALFELARAATPETSIIAGRTSNLRSGVIAGAYASTWNGDMPGSLFFLGVNQPGSLLRLAAVRAAGGVCEDLHYTMDLDLWLRLLLRGGASSLARTSALVAVYRYHDNSKTGSGHDVFAAEELAVMLGLFRALTPEPALATLVPRNSRTRPFNIENIPAWPAGTVVRPLLERLLIKDSLLFRGLWRQAGDMRKAITAFRAHLHQLEVDLSAIYGEQAPAIRANALLHAMEAANRLSPSAAIEALRLAPSLHLLRALLRLLIRRAKS